MQHELWMRKTDAAEYDRSRGPDEERLLRTDAATSAREAEALRKEWAANAPQFQPPAAKLT